MKLLLCPNCNEGKLTQENGFFRCAICGSLLSMEEKKDIEERIEEAISRGIKADLGVLRHQLNDELEADYPDPDIIIERCDDILRVLPEDILATAIKRFYRRKSHRKQYHQFLLDPSVKLNAYQKKALYPYLIDKSEAIDEQEAKAFLKNQGDESLFPRLQKALERRSVEEELYANVTRDVFICHARKDLERIMPLLNKLEQEDCYRIWYCERNMPIDVRNYRDYIQAAIGKCEVFLVFASSVSMQSEDVQWELDTAEKLGKTKRLEYRLEDRNNSVRFKHFFQGIQWIDGAEKDNYGLLSERIYELLHASSNVEPEDSSLDSIPVVARAKPKKEEEPFVDLESMTVFYGIFPQTVVEDPALINQLDGLKKKEANGWYLHQGRYYHKRVARPNERGALFFSGTEIEREKTYWFLCEPIKWRILAIEEGSLLLLSELALDSSFGGDYGNDYSRSAMRAWLNGKFLHSAFCLGRSAILKSRIDNSPASTGEPDNPNTCEDLDDAVFLLSAVDVENPLYGFTHGGKKTARPTDFALAHSIRISDYNKASPWWLRSPSSNSGEEFLCLNSFGLLSSESAIMGTIGLRPAIRIAFSKESDEVRKPLPEKASLPDASKPVLSRNGKSVFYGYYPQTVVEEPALLAELKKIPSPQGNGWYLHQGRYYAKILATPYEDEYSFASGKRVMRAQEYWFACEPIKWRILRRGGDRCVLMSERLLDVHGFDPRSNIKKNTNDYSLSEIRRWLNGDFLQTAFSLGSSNILWTLVNNSPSSTEDPENPPECCENTKDKVFLLSYAEVMSESFGFRSFSEREGVFTDYALARGIYSYEGKASWWLRSPSKPASDALRVDTWGLPSHYYVAFVDVGIRPVIQIKL